MQPLLVDRTQNIPPELWVNIFSHLSHQGLIVSSLVSHFFKDISSDQLIWKDLTRRYYPDTHAQLSKKQFVQHIEEGNKKRKVASPVEIDWKQQFIERVLFFSAAKKGQLECTTLLTPNTINRVKYLEKEQIRCLDFFDGKPYAGVGARLVTFDEQEKLVEITPELDHVLSSIKVEKRKNGMIYVYTGDHNGNIFSWGFNGSQFEQKKKISKDIGKISVLEICQETLISAGGSKLRFWDKEEGTLLKTFKSVKSSDHYCDLTVDKNLIFASTSLGAIKIWDAITHKSLPTMHFGNNHKFTKVVVKIRVVGNEIFYSNNAGIFAVNLEQKSIRHIVKEILTCYDFEVFDGKIFYYRMKKSSSSRGIWYQPSRGICIFDIKTLTVESGPFSLSHTNNFDTGFRVGSYGILHSGKKLYITQLETKN